MDEDNIDIEYKILLLGDTDVGKTSLIIRYLEDKFDENYTSTIGLDVRYKDMVKNNKKIRLNIWDTAGQERFRSMTNNFLNGAQGIILVCDITNKDTFSAIKKWSTNSYFSSEKNIEIIIVENKIDLEDQRKISENELKKFGEKNNIEVFNSSAKTGEGVKEAFECLINKLCNNKIIGINNEIEYQNRKKSFRLLKSDNNTNKSIDKNNCKC